MASIFGASLRDILRQGSQFGLGVQEAGRQNRYAQQQADAERAKQQQLIAQALLEQENTRSQIKERNARAKSLSAPEGPKWEFRTLPDGRIVRAEAAGGTFDPMEKLNALSAPKPPSASDKGIASRKAALKAKGIVGPEAEAIASDETLFRTWYGQQNPGTGGGDDVGERKRVFPRRLNGPKR